jgi:GDP-L-fucose synthase
MNLPDPAFDALLETDEPLINIGCGEDLTIRDLTHIVKAAVGFTGDVTWDSSKPDGTPRKLLDVSRLSTLGWRAKMPLEQGIPMAYGDFMAQASTR